MPIDRAAVDHVARLARLDLTDDERERMRAELTHILEHAEKIQALDLDAVPPTSHSVSIRNAMRPDEVTPSLSPEEVLANAPEVEDGRIKVPRIIEDA
ncbi:MAG TPA: Asp-tRNA(Asn)/Glu-tRNA(Gln) amidotransferase subunit GatC [Actinomycetota bacterium]|nr:Asp-tRNA(Asn)/Glu-tRNA(Gln) amidotransferase subunit GatC [Actinomycetota bacterium]